MAWNKPTSGEAVSRPLHKGTSESILKRKGFRFSVGIAAVAFVGVAAWWLCRPSESAPKQAKPATKPSRIAVVTPAAAPVAKPVETNYAELVGKELRRVPESETNRLTAAQIEYWKMFHPYPPPSKFQPLVHRGEWEIFEERVDNEIAGVLSIEPGETLLGIRGRDERFERRFLKSLTRPIIVKEDDSDYAKNLKRAVIEAKADLKAAYDRGEDITQIMEDARNEMQRLGQYKANLEKEAMKLARRANSADEVADTIGAVNKMLEDKGIAPIELNSMSRLAVKYQKLKGESVEE